MDPAIVETPYVPTGDSEIHTSDFDVGHLLGFNDRGPNILFGKGCIDDFTFADTTRTGLSKTDNVHRAFRAKFTDDGANLGGANFQSNDNRRAIKHAFSWFGEVWQLSVGQGEQRSPPSLLRECYL